MAFARVTTWVPILGVLLLSGCAVTPETAHLEPHLKVQPDDFGHGASVTLRVLDLRESPTLGNRGFAGHRSADITPDVELSATVAQRLGQALSQEGFVVRVVNDPSSDLKVEIRGFRYQIAQGFFVNKNQVDAVFYVLATRGKSQYEHVYRASVEQGSQVALTADNNTAMLNDALSDVLSQICIDDGLLHTLATP